MSSRKRLFLLDGHALAYRAYFALTATGGGSRWMTQSGEPTAGTYGFTSILLRLLEQEDPEYLAVAFDTGKTFRDEIYPEYKATREKMPEDLKPQLNRIRQIVQTFAIPVLEAEGFEADDVLGTVAKRAAAEGVDVVIVTGDRDLLQLADDHVQIQLSGQRLSEAIDYGPEEVRHKLGILPQQLADYKGLVGDSSDNIPGVRGVGEKTAVSLLGQYQTLDEIYAHLEEVPARFRNKLEEGREEAYLSKKLAVIVTDVEIAFDLESCQTKQYDRNVVGELFRELEFRSLLDRLPAEGAGQQLSLFTGDTMPRLAADLVEPFVVDTPEALQALVRRLEDAEVVAFDVETTSTEPMRAGLVGVSLAVEPGRGYYIPLGHLPGLDGGRQLDKAAVMEALRPALTDPSKPKVGHNLKYDYILLARNGLCAFPLAFDSMIAEWLCNPASRNLGLKSLAWVRLGVEMTHIEDLIGKGQNQRTMAEVPIADAAPYAAADAEVCLRLKPELERELGEKRQTGLFREVEMPLVSVLAEMEMAGVRLDTGFLSKLSNELAGRLEDIEREIFGQVGHKFNINSTQQLSTVLFDELGLKPPARTRRTTSGHYSTAASVLDDLREAHPVVALILDQREVAKLKSTYTDALPAQVNPHTGRVHTSFSQTGSVTGRLASSNPNLQNIPIRTELGRRIRRAFVTEPGWCLLGVDYSQIELRVVAHMAQDKAMIQAFLDDQDIHATTASAVFGVPITEVTPGMRRRAKAVNFGLIYGMSAFGLSRASDLTLAEAEDFVKAYFERFPGVQGYLETTKRQAREEGFVETLLGRRRYFPQLTRGAPGVSEQARARALREAINAPIQGTAADIIKLAMLRLPSALVDAGLNARMLLQVHDELLLECPLNEIDPAEELVHHVMGNAYTLRVPLKTDAKRGLNWEQMTA